MIHPFTGATEVLVPAGAELSAEQLIMIAVPAVVHESKIKIDDPIFPLELDVPEGNHRCCEPILGVMRKEPVITFQRLKELFPEEALDCLEPALQWMFCTGLLLRTHPIEGSIEPEDIGPHMSKPLFSIKSVDFTDTDVIAIK